MHDMGVQVNDRVLPGLSLSYLCLTFQAVYYFVEIVQLNCHVSIYAPKWAKLPHNIKVALDLLLHLIQGTS